MVILDERGKVRGRRTFHRVSLFSHSACFSYTSGGLKQYVCESHKTLFFLLGVFIQVVLHCNKIL